jgi:hypothetical protein
MRARSSWPTISIESERTGRGDWFTLPRSCRDEHAGEPGDHDQRGSALGNDAVEGSHQRVDLALAPVQPLRDDQTVRRVLGAQREWLDAAGRVPGQTAPPQIDRETGGGLVAILGGLGEELHHDRGEARDAGNPLIGAGPAAERCDSAPTPSDRQP